MDEKELFRRLVIGFSDFLSLDERKLFIENKTPLSEIAVLNNGKDIREAEVYATVKWLEKSPKHKIWWYGDENYPVFNMMDKHLPYMLFVDGNIPVKRNSIAVVGTRNVDNSGFQMAYKLGLESSFNNYSVISGMADGCDQAALNGAVDGPTPCFAVLGCGLNVDYPKYSNRLKKRIIEEGGALISRFSPDTLPLKYNFPNRNVIISAMSDCCLVVQAPKKSGSLITADFSLQMGKDVYVSQAGIGRSWNRIGTDKLASEGASVVFSMDGISKCAYMAFETEYANGQVFRFGSRQYILKKIRNM